MLTEIDLEITGFDFISSPNSSKCLEVKEIDS